MKRNTVQSRHRKGRENKDEKKIGSILEALLNKPWVGLFNI